MLKSNVPGYPRREGKVRDVYDLGDRLVIVATDRISAFDWVLPTPIPDKGRVLTALTLFWLRWLQVPNHLLSADSARFPDVRFAGPSSPAGRCSFARPTSCRSSASFAAISPARAGRTIGERARSAASRCRPGLRECEQLPEPIFTPATKAETGHDENISFEQMCSAVGRGTADELRDRRASTSIAGRPSTLPAAASSSPTRSSNGAGCRSGELILIDEVLTPDSSRFWPADSYEPGRSQPSFDKQFVRDWLETTTWDKNSPPPALPADVVAKTQAEVPGGGRAAHGSCRWPSRRHMPRT